MKIKLEIVTLESKFKLEIVNLNLSLNFNFLQNKRYLKTQVCLIFFKFT